MSKAQTRLEPGTYRLCGDDLPPLRSDKRKHNDWRYNTIHAGQLFFYNEWTYAPNEEKPEATVTEQRIYPVGRYETESVRPNESSETRILEESLVRLEETPSLWIRRAHGLHTGLRVLDVLVATGKLTMGQVMEIANSVESQTAGHETSAVVGDKAL